MIIPQRIIIHHSGTNDGPEMSWAAIRRWHIEHNGWIDIGYHLGVEKIGDTYEALMGRPWTTAGAHTAGQNQISLGICLVGNFNLAEPPVEQILIAARFVSMWCAIYRIPSEEIYLHRNFNPTDCPGEHFNLERFKKAVMLA